MVAKTPTKERTMAAVAVAFNPNVVKETLRKVDRCMARLEELQYTVAGGRKTVAGVSLSPRSTRGYLRTSVRCKQESLRMKTSNARRSPAGKFQGIANGDWRGMSLQAMLLDETVLEILNASKFAKEVVTAAAAAAAAAIDPTTPVTTRRSSNKPSRESTETMQARRTKEKKHGRLKTTLSESSPVGTRAKSSIRFKSNSPPSRRREEKKVIYIGRPSVKADRVSPTSRPWAKKTVLFPNPLFLPSSPSSPLPSSRKTFYKTKSPIIARRQKPHKFLIKSPSSSLKAQLKSKKVVPAATPAKSPPRKAVATKARRASFSPSKLLNRMVSPLKTRIFLHKSSVGLLSGLKQRPVPSSTTTVPSIRKL